MAAKQSVFDYGCHETSCRSLNQRNNKHEVYSCKKSKFHKHYKLAQDFTIDDLPKKFRKENIFELTQTIADLAVLIEVSYVSPERKRTHWQNTTEGYPCSEMAGKYGIMHGSGRITDVFPSSEDQKYSNVRCPCQKCKRASPGSGIVWLLKVHTATHVVFDNSEARNTVCKLFYNSYPEGANPVQIYGLDQIFAHVSGDLCILTCVTCEENLANLIKQKIKRFNQLWQELQKIYGKNKNKNDLIIIVSHPHGLPKQISVGFWKSYVPEKDNRGHRYVYNIPTCPGSSGAPVYILGVDWFDTVYCHSGGSLEQNYSTIWIPELENVPKSNSQCMLI